MLSGWTCFCSTFLVARYVPGSFTTTGTAFDYLRRFWFWMQSAFCFSSALPIHKVCSQQTQTKTSLKSLQTSALVSWPKCDVKAKAVGLIRHHKSIQNALLRVSAKQGRLAQRRDTLKPPLECVDFARTALWQPSPHRRVQSTTCRSRSFALSPH